MKVTDFFERVNQRVARVRDLSESSSTEVSERVVILEDCMSNQLQYDEETTVFMRSMSGIIASQRESIANLKVCNAVTGSVAILALLVALSK